MTLRLGITLAATTVRENPADQAMERGDCGTAIDVYAPVNADFSSAAEQAPSDDGLLKRQALYFALGAIVAMPASITLANLLSPHDEARRPDLDAAVVGHGGKTPGAAYVAGADDAGRGGWQRRDGTWTGSVLSGRRRRSVSRTGFDGDIETWEKI
ncbi:hypothetical protein [Actinoplanes sp. NPDC026623]|uniref:hypothetical protein n=1 Tax=Actinoplanes sp. NPDC026623 TaxID=3155610 RepID=UPI00340D06D7